MNRSEFLFGDIVVVDDDQIGVIVKSWGGGSTRENHYDIYVRSYNKVKEYDESIVERYRVRHKYLNDDEMGYQRR